MGSMFDEISASVICKMMEVAYEFPDSCAFVKLAKNEEDIIFYTAYLLRLTSKVEFTYPA